MSKHTQELIYLPEIKMSQVISNPQHQISYGEKYKRMLNACSQIFYATFSASFFNQHVRHQHKYPDPHESIWAHIL